MDRAEDRRRVEVDRAKVDMARERERERKEKMTVGGQGGEGDKERRERRLAQVIRSTGEVHPRLGIQKEDFAFLEVYTKD